jgi:hypothetical protein
MKKLVKPVDVNQEIEDNYQALAECYACNSGCLCDTKVFADEESDDILF